MKSFLRLLPLLLLTLSAPVPADQTDAGLDELFTRLKLSTDSRQLQFIEASIWEKWMQHENEDVERLLLLATRRMNAGRHQQALLVFSELVQSCPDFAEAWNKRATLYYILGDLEASMADIDRTLELEPRHFGALSGAGLIHIRRGELQQARQRFETLLEIHPNSENARNNLEHVRSEIQRSTI
jgi:Flp pilus assembly protein TadD